MALIAVVGPNAALLEGVSQTLVGAAHTAVIARDVHEAIETLRDSRPLVAIVDCDEMMKSQSSARIPLAPTSPFGPMGTGGSLPTEPEKYT